MAKSESSHEGPNHDSFRRVAIGANLPTSREFERPWRAGIFGGSGYGGSELLRILLFHPGVSLDLVTAGEHAGKKISHIHRNLLALTDLCFAPQPTDAEELRNLDVLFLALPHGHSAELFPQLPCHLRVVDLSGDFRLRDLQEYERYYGRKRDSGVLPDSFVYGLTETLRDEISGARCIANPGCFATATLLGLAPLVATGVLHGRVIVDAKTGSSGSGAKAAANTHHPQRANSFYAYKPLEHQHIPEIEQELKRIGDWTGELVFVTHSLPVVRGVFASMYCETSEPTTRERIESIFAEFYRNSFFVRLVGGSPDINWVKNTNFCDIGLAVRGKQVVVFTAIDNLVKGAAGQAVQNMNLMLGIDERTGLLSSGSNP